MEAVENRNNGFNLLIMFLLIGILLLVLVLQSCTSQRYTYKVTFQNGDVEYYDLTYKPKKGSAIIEYDGETIIGVQNIERVK